MKINSFLRKTKRKWNEIERTESHTHTHQRKEGLCWKTSTKEEEEKKNSSSKPISSLPKGGSNTHTHTHIQAHNKK